MILRLHSANRLGFDGITPAESVVGGRFFTAPVTYTRVIHLLPETALTSGWCFPDQSTNSARYARYVSFCRHLRRAKAELRKTESRK